MLFQVSKSVYLLFGNNGVLIILDTPCLSTKGENKWTVFTYITLLWIGRKLSLMTNMIQLWKEWDEDHMLNEWDEET